MDPKKVRQRKQGQGQGQERSGKEDGGRSDGNGVKGQTSLDNANVEGGGISCRCAIVILLLVFVTIFTATVVTVSFGMNKAIFGSIGDNIWGLNDEASPSEPDVIIESDQVDTDSLKDESQNVLFGQQIEEKKERVHQGAKPTLDKPTILWWTEDLFPHAHRGSISEITCGEHTCLTTDDKRVLSDPLTRGIMFYGTDFRPYEAPLPRQPWHEWALLHEESPMNNYALVHGMKLFNHSATFRRQSDYPTTTHCLPTLEYLTERQPVPIEEKNSLRKKGLAPILYVQSHCDVASDRDRYVKELMEHIKVDSYGKCLNNKEMPEHLSNPVDSMEAKDFYDFIGRYKFHLSFENSICDDYITEKFFRPMHVGSVPIYRGSPSAKDWSPGAKSFINVDMFESPKQLAYFIKLLDENDDIYLDHLAFKENGVTNQLLLDHMNSRPYAVNDWDMHSFISGFECHVCERISERYQAEQGSVPPNHPLLERKIGQSIQMGCPPPHTSVGRLDEAPETDGIHTWVQDYWGMRDQVVALEEMIRQNESDSAKLFDFIERIYNERHTQSNSPTA